jgi:hypothetical protein
MKDQLMERGIVVVSNVPEPLGGVLVFRNWREGRTLSLSGQIADLF